MQTPVLFWFDFGSPYAWLASAQLRGVAERIGRDFAWHAILLGVVFRQTGMAPLSQQGMRGAYARRDIARQAWRLGLPFATETVPEGTSLACARVFHALDLADPALAARFGEAALMAAFGHGERLDSIAAAQDLAARLGPAAREAATRAEGPAARAALRTATEEAIRRGVFGAPFFEADGEPFWGQDRLPMLEQWLRSGGW